MKILRIFHISLIILIIISGYIFSKSNGLVFKGDNKDIYITEQLSTGSDDNIAIEFSVILFIPLLIVSLFKIKKSMSLLEYLFNDLICFSQIFYLLCIETGSIINTMVFNHNESLWMWIISFVLFICLIQFFYFTPKCQLILKTHNSIVSTNSKSPKK